MPKNQLNQDNRALFKRIESAFKKLNISLSKPLNESDAHFMAESVTNQFFKVKDSLNRSYLVRMNGKLWPPFTRKGEDDNLSELKRHKIGTNVIYNDKAMAFQISRLHRSSRTFESAHNENNSKSLLNATALAIKTVHKVPGFKGSFSVPHTVNKAYRRLAQARQSQTEDIYQMIIMVLKVLYTEKENHVSSHNDLLPSSVYWKNNRVTFVDWEYSGENHRAYDLALFAIKSSLSASQEQYLISRYDRDGSLDLSYSFSLMKPVVSFLLMLWASAAAESTHTSLPSLLSGVQAHAQEAYVSHSARTLLTENRLGFFDSAKAAARQKPSLSSQHAEQTADLQMLPPKGV